MRLHNFVFLGLMAGSTIFTSNPNRRIQPAALPAPEQEQEQDWYANQIMKDQIISDPAIIAKYQKEIDQIKSYKKSREYKLQLFSNKESLEKISKQAAHLRTLVGKFAQKPWVDGEMVREATTVISRFWHQVSGYLNHPALIDKELSDLKIPAVRMRVEQLVRMWDDSLKQIYQLSVLDSQQQVPGKEKDNLVLINPWSNQLIFDGQGRILVASWVPEYVKKFWPVGQPKLIQGFVPWVSIVPEVKTFVTDYVSKNMQNKTGFSLYERISQVFGLPQLRDGIDVPRYFVEMWVDPKDLVRPCLDSTVVGNGCYLDKDPQGTPTTFTDLEKYVPAFDDKATWMNNEPMMTVREWFNTNKKKTYTGSSAFPWTRLGYTYDIGSLSPSKAGFSEFLVKPDSTVQVHSVTETSDYPTMAMPQSAYKYSGPRLSK